MPDTTLPTTTETNLSEKEETSAPKSQTRREKRREKKRKKKINICEFDPKNDIKYRGPLSYRYLRVLAWVFFWMSQAGFVLTIVAQRDAYAAEHYPMAGPLLSLFSGAMTPLFLIATFATMLNGSKKIRNLLITYGFFAALVVILFELVYYRYFLGTLSRATMSDPELFGTFLPSLANLVSKKKSLAFVCNIFIDLFLCSLFVCFIFYNPKKVFVGKKLIIFRLFALFPIFYEIASIVLKILVGFQTLTLPMAIYPFLTTKPPLTFVLFIALVFYVKRREKKFFLSGKTEEEYRAFMNTNYNSWQFSKFTAKTILVIAIADLLIVFILSFVLTYTLSVSAEVAATSVTQAGFGKSTTVLWAIPFVLLFSYSRTHNSPMLDVGIPVAAIIILVLMYLETIYQLADQFPDLINGLFG